MKMKQTKGSQRPGRKLQISKPPAEDNTAPAPLVNKVVITNRNPSKKSMKLCTQLRKIFDPDGMTNLKEKHPRVSDFLEVADHFLISHIITVSDMHIHVGVRPRGPTYVFKILEYDPEFKNFGAEIYKHPAFITFEGRSVLKPVFERFGKNEAGFRRALHFRFEDDQILVRHYCVGTKDTDDNFRVGLREIGPRLTLQLVEKEEGFYPNLRASKGKRSSKED